MTSLGFNQLHPVRIHSLPGAVHSQAVPPRRRRSPETTVTKQVITPRPSTNPPSMGTLPSTTSQLQSSSVGMLNRRMSFVEDALKTSSSIQEQIRTVTDDFQSKMETMYSELQVVYGTVQGNGLENTKGDIVAKKGERVCLLYPMETDESNGKVVMNMKKVDPNTADISLMKVCVYDPKQKTQHVVNNFSACP